MKKYRCKDFHILKIRSYADKSMMKFYHNENHPRYTEACKQHWERAQSYTKFKWLFINEVTQLKNDRYWYEHYGFFADECALEYIQEKYGVIVERGEGWVTYMIPKKKTELFEWCKENLPNNPYKVMKRTLINYYNYRNEDLTWKRKEYFIPSGQLFTFSDLEV